MQPGKDIVDTAPASGPSPAEAASTWRREWIAPTLGLWFGSRLALLIFVGLASFVLDLDHAQRGASRMAWLLDRFAYWDSGHFVRIAERGYPRGVCCDPAYFPGYPLAMKVGSFVLGGNLVLSGLLISLIAGAVAVLLLWRLGTDVSGDPRVGTAAATYLVVAPYGIFLSAVYSESLFLALALGAWWAGTRHRWWLAGALAGLASGVRINGLFLAAGLAVMYAGQLHREGRLLPRPRPRIDALALLAPGLVVAAFFTFLRVTQGSWNTWLQTQKEGFLRESAWPWEGLAAGWDAVWSPSAPHVVVSEWAELLTVLAGIALVSALLWLRRWPEATYLGLSVLVLISSTPLVSSPRYALLWFPGYLLAAQLAMRPGNRWLHVGLLAVCIPLLACFALSFSARGWVS